MTFLRQISQSPLKVVIFINISKLKNINEVVIFDGLPGNHANSIILKNQIVDKVGFRKIFSESKVDTIIFDKCILDNVSFEILEQGKKIVIMNSIINHLDIHGTWFFNGFELLNSNIIQYVDYQMGGHNLMSEKIIIKNNVFSEFFNFFDCIFYGPVIIENNIFLKGTNILGNLQASWVNKFDIAPIVLNNIGKIDYDGEGVD